MKLIWTKKALSMWIDGKADSRHTISAPNIAECYQGFVAQFKNGTPWALVSDAGEILDTGTAGYLGLV